MPSTGDEEEGEPSAKKGKNKLIYGKFGKGLLWHSQLTDFCLGVDSSKWYKAKKAKPAAAAALSAANTEVNFEDREAVYEDHRDELTAEFR